MVQNIEAIAWSAEVVKDQRRYGKLKGLLKKSLPIGIRNVQYTDLTKPIKKITIRFNPSNTKFINPYTFLGLMINVPKATTGVLQDIDIAQIYPDTETSASAQLGFTVKVTYNERNPDFHMAKV